MSDLVERLTTEQPIEASLRPEPSLKLFKACLDRGYVHLKFTGTRGGTELGVRLDPEASDLSAADFDAGEGEVKLVGDLTLDYQRVRCHGTIDLATLKGTGHLEPLPDPPPAAESSSGDSAVVH
ncbi:MAG: MbtH domain protein [Acidobacteriota bacterium]